MATVAGIVVHCVAGLIGWTAAAVMSTVLSRSDIVDHPVGGCQSQNMTRHYKQVSEKADYHDIFSIFTCY